MIPFLHPTTDLLLTNIDKTLILQRMSYDYESKGRGFESPRARQRKVP